MSTLRSFTRNAPALSVLALTLTAPVRADVVTSYSGDAFAARLTIESSTTNTYGSTGELPVGGGELEGLLVNFQDPLNLLNIVVALLETSGVDDVATTQLEIQNVNFFGSMLEVGLIRAATSVTPLNALGFSVVDNISVRGNLIDVTGALNQVVELTPFLGVPGTLTLNQHVNSSSPGHNEFTVNAVDFSVPGSFRLILGHAHSDVNFDIVTRVPEPGTIGLLALACVLCLCSAMDRRAARRRAGRPREN